MVNSYDVAVLSEKVAYLEAALKTAGVLPEVSASDNGATLQVVNGSWAKGDEIPAIINALDSTSTTDGLSAAQGKALSDKWDDSALSVSVEEGQTYISNFSVDTNIRKINNILIANLYFFASGSATDDWVKIGHIDGWNVKSASFAPVVGQDANFSMITVRISTVGDVYLYTPATLTGANFRCQVVGIGS